MSPDGLPHDDPESPPEPDGPAEAVFGSALPTARSYAALLAGDGVAHGHLGPREIPRLWSRHLVNSALLTDLIPSGERVIDIGSGAGLPGIPMALRRPDLSLVLVEPMLRRVEFLHRAVVSVPVPNATVVRGRAEAAVVEPARFVVARAVAPLDRLVGWCLPLLGPGGMLLAQKGASAQDEVARTASAVQRLGGRVSSVRTLGEGPDQTWVVSIEQVERQRVGR